MPSQEDIYNQQVLLNTHRRTMQILLRQVAMQGSANVSTATLNSLYDARREIIRIKGVLRDWGIVVDDHPDDEGMLEFGSISVEGTGGVASVREFSKKRREFRLFGILIFSISDDEEQFKQLTRVNSISEVNEGEVKKGEDGEHRERIVAVLRFDSARQLLSYGVR